MNGGAGTEGGFPGLRPGESLVEYMDRLHPERMAAARDEVDAQVGPRLPRPGRRKRV